MKAKKVLLEGIITNNPTFIMVLGMCPVVGMSYSLINSFYLGVSTAIVLILSNLVISLVGKIIPDKVRIPCYVIIIATLVTTIDLALRKYFPDIYTDIGRFVQLIVVNCIILARAEAFAASNKPLISILDGFSVGIGFLLGICLLGVFREFISAGTLWGIDFLKDIPGKYPGVGAFAAPVGGFIILGLFMGIFNAVRNSIDSKAKTKQALAKKLIANGGKV